MTTRTPNRAQKTGSPLKGEPEYVLIGKFQRAHGVTGEIVLGIETDFPERIRPGKVVYLGNQHVPRKITGTRPFHEKLLITLEGIKNREEVAELTNLQVFVKTGDLPSLDKGQFYHHQLIGLPVMTDNNSQLGTIREILATGANDVYVVVDENGKEILLPAIESVILDIDLDLGRVLVKPPEWE